MAGITLEVGLLLMNRLTPVKPAILVFILAIILVFRIEALDFFSPGTPLCCQCENWEGAEGVDPLFRLTICGSSRSIAFSSVGLPVIASVQPGLDDGMHMQVKYKGGVPYDAVGVEMSACRSNVDEESKATPKPGMLQARGKKEVKSGRDLIKLQAEDGIADRTRSCATSSKCTPPSGMFVHCRVPSIRHQGAQ